MKDIINIINILNESSRNIDIKVLSIKRLKYDTNNGENLDTNAYYILNTSYPDNLSFMDKVDNYHKLVLAYDDVTSGSNSFDMKLAQEVVGFVCNITSGTLYVCCDQGESRSTAMAAAILRFIGKDEMIIWKDPHYHPNILVYGTLCKAFGFDDSGDRLEELKQINDKSLSDTIASTR